MNNLTKIYLAGHHHKFADDIRSKNKIETFLEGMQSYKEIDWFISNHPSFIKSKGRISIFFQKYAEEIVKAYYDHFLALNWNQYSNYTLREYLSATNILLTRNYSLLPHHLKKTFRIISRKDTVLNYESIHGFHEGIKITGNKCRKFYVAESIGDMINSYTQLQDDFHCLFADLLEYSTKLKTSQNQLIAV